jgi:hypothetical protein
LNLKKARAEDSKVSCIYGWKSFVVSWTESRRLPEQVSSSFLQCYIIIPKKRNHHNSKKDRAIVWYWLCNTRLGPIYALKSISFWLTLLLLLLSRNKCRNGNDKITESFISTTVRDTGNKQVKKRKKHDRFWKGENITGIWRAEGACRLVYTAHFVKGENVCKSRKRRHYDAYTLNKKKERDKSCMYGRWLLYTLMS